MNPLTQVKLLQKINSIESSLGISEEASWHTKYKDSAYIFIGGVPFDLTEGDLLAVFAQYGEIVDLNLVREKESGKPKGFAFLAYEDQRSTILAVDNLNGAKLLGRVIRVDHVSKYKKKEEEEDGEKEKQKREARGICRAFQRGECNRGDSCKFSHNEQRSANTGWGPQDSNARWGHDMFEKSLNGRRDLSHGREHKKGKVKSSLPDEGQVQGHPPKTHGDDSHGKSSSYRVEHDSGRERGNHASRSELEKHTPKEVRSERQGSEKTRNRKPEPDKEDDGERRGSNKRSRHYS
uniref:Zinc finger CCCH domain-containing protein 42 n=1 Tax=Anthurium amnicola TaxID=1678845 RepID=A0A1D1XU39_9ARAE